MIEVRPNIDQKNLKRKLLHMIELTFIFILTMSLRLLLMYGFEKKII